MYANSSPCEGKEVKRLKDVAEINSPRCFNTTINETIVDTTDHAVSQKTGKQTPRIAACRRLECN